jgi:hypothetical protein
VVENKRLGAALAFIKARQDAPPPAPRVKRASETGGYVRQGRKSARRSWLLPGAARTAPTMLPPLAPGLKAAASGGPLRGVQRRGLGWCRSTSLSTGIPCTMRYRRL